MGVPVASGGPRGRGRGERRSGQGGGNEAHEEIHRQCFECKSHRQEQIQMVMTR
jgi:hypothetical protein